MYLDFLLFLSSVIAISVSYAEDVEMPYATLWAIFPIVATNDLWLQAVLVASAVWYDEPYAYVCLFVAYSVSWMPMEGYGKTLLNVLLTVGAAIAVMENNDLVDPLLYVSAGVLVLFGLMRKYTNEMGFFFVLGMACAVTAFFLELKSAYYILNYTAAYSFTRAIYI